MGKVLITGGAGFIGSNVAKKLIKLGHEVTIYDNFNKQIHGNNQALEDEISKKVELLVADITDKSSLYKALKGKTSVIHLAAETGTGQSMYDISHYTNVNIQGTSYLCDYIVNEKHTLENIIVASSRSIYGEGKYIASVGNPIYPESRTISSVQNGFDVINPENGENDLKLVATDEDSQIHPASFYGITKQVQEQMIILACKLKNINGFALRYQNVYGPGQSLKNPYTGILSIFSRLALKNEIINVFEDGKESRDFVFIEDVVEATVKCLKKEIVGQHILNVGSGVSTSVLDVAYNIVRYLNSKSEVIVSGNFREGDIRHNYADLHKVKKVLGFEPATMFNDGLKKFLNWVLSQNDLPSTNEDYKKSLIELENRGLLK